jgi:energy-coupling factor transporter transmembrane protein EcfT
MSEEVYLAMVSRGYTGHPRTLSTSRVRATDIAWIAFCLLIVVAVIGIDRAIGR